MNIQILANTCLAAFHIREASRSSQDGKHALAFRQAAERACHSVGLEDVTSVIEVMTTNFETYEWSRRIMDEELSH